MIMIDSKAGQRLAKAKAAIDRWKARGGKGETTGHALRCEYASASISLANELIADGHADAEDY